MRSMCRGAWIGSTEHDVFPGADTYERTGWTSLSVLHSSHAICNVEVRSTEHDANTYEASLGGLRTSKRPRPHGLSPYDPPLVGVKGHELKALLKPLPVRSFVRSFVRAYEMDFSRVRFTRFGMDTDSRGYTDVLHTCRHIYYTYIVTLLHTCRHIGTYEVLLQITERSRSLFWEIRKAVLCTERSKLLFWGNS